MNTIRDLIGAGDSPSWRTTEELVLSDCGVGVEVELEHTRDLVFPEYPWRVVEEGSLHQDGLELIFALPLAGRDVIEALVALEEACKGSYVSTGNDTSLHVHIDVRDLTPQQVWKFMMLYTMFESVLFNYCGGSTRESNIFCVGTKHSPSKIRAYSDTLPLLLAGKEHAFVKALAGTGRYSSMNAEAVKKFGSLEFRGHEGEWHSKVIVQWINILQCLKKATLNNSISWERPYLTAKREGIRQMAHDIFGKHLKVLNYDGFVPDVTRGCQHARAMVNTARADISQVLKGCRNDKRYSMKRQYNAGKPLVSLGATPLTATSLPTVNAVPATAFLHYDVNALVDPTPSPNIASLAETDVTRGDF